MEQFTNRFGEIQTNWTSHKHPSNPNFMQVVKYMHVQHPDGRNILHWCLFNAAANDHHHIYGITLEDAKAKFMDSVEPELTEEYFENWLKSRQ